MKCDSSEPENEDGSPVSISHNIFKEVRNLITVVNNEIHDAATRGDARYLKVLLEQSSVDKNQVNMLGRNALHIAILADSPECAKILIDAGVNINAEDKLNFTPLSLCLLTSNPYMIPIIELLFERGAYFENRKSTDDLGVFLRYVVGTEPTRSEIEVLKLLLSHGAKINDPESPGGRQALHLAAMSDNCHLIEVLLEFGADPFMENHCNQTPLDVAVVFNCFSAKFFLERAMELYRSSSGRSNYSS